MQTKKYTFDYLSYACPEELPEQDRLLVERAREACLSAYAPYSGFRVGAALRLANGQIRIASNQESEVLPSGMCAERALLYYVQGQDPGVRIEAMAIASDPATGECTPCGACRQVLFDTEKRQGAPIRILMAGARSATVVRSVRDLLPFTFILEV